MKIEKLYNILLEEKPSIFIKEYEKEIFDLIPDLEISKGFNQNNIWHIYDVYEHILHVIDGVPSKLNLRLSALFHDIGKPYTYTKDENNIGHFYGHWDKSTEIFNKFAKENKLDNRLINSVSKLISYHDIRVNKLSDEELKKIVNNFDVDEINLLFELRRSDLLAQNPKFHYLLDDYIEEEKRLIKIFKSCMEERK